jgi:phage terminase small subunit
MTTKAMELGERCCSWSLYYSSNVKKKEDSGGTSPAKAYATKKTKSPGLMLASDAAPLFTLHVRLGTCHPISRRRLAREPVILNREGGSSAAMAVDGDQRL